MIHPSEDKLTIRSSCSLELKWVMFMQKYYQQLTHAYMQNTSVSKYNKTWTGPWSAARFKPEVHPKSKLTKCPEQEQGQDWS